MNSWMIQLKGLRSGETHRFVEWYVKLSFRCPYRQRYWWAVKAVLPSVSLICFCCRLRSYLGYKPVRDALPNPTHYALAALQYTSVAPRLITQNVDGLHHKALAHVWNERRLRERVLELHGTLHVRAPFRYQQDGFLLST